MKRRPALIVGVAAAVAVAVAVVAVVTGRAPRAQTSPTAHAPSVQTVAVRYGSYTEYVVAVGRVGSPAGSESKLAFAAPGIVKALDVRVGDRVAAGEPLAELDAGGLAIDAAQAQDDVQAAAATYGDGSVSAQARAAAQARLAAARVKLGSQSRAKIEVDTRALAREQALYAGGVAAAKDVDAARAQLAVDQADDGAARAEVAQAEADLRTARSQGQTAAAQLASAEAKAAAARRNLANAALRAPAAGVVTAIFKHVGEAVDPSQPVLTIGAPSNDVVTLSLDGADARKVRTGDTVTISDSTSAVTGTGIVRTVVPSVDPATQMSAVVVEGVPAGAAAGDAVQARIAVATRRGIVVPTAAIVDDPQTGTSLVFVRSTASNGGFTARTVTVAAGDERRSLVAGGLRPGEVIATEGAYDLLAPSGGGG